MIDLTQPFSAEMPHAASMPAPTFETISDVRQDGINVQRYCVPTHVGTHVDAPRHFIEGGRTIDEIPLEAFAGDAVVLDVSKESPAEVTVADIRAAPGEVRPDDIVLLSTGWEENYGTPEYDPHPWLSAEAATWLADRDVKLVGVDTITPDLPLPLRPEGWTEFPVHRTLLGSGVLVAEHLTNLAPHTGRRLEVHAYPVKIDGGDGAPARFVAHEPGD